MSMRHHLLRLFALFTLLSHASANPPTWWSDGTPPILTGTPENNKGPANIGQAKWMVAEALRTLDTVAPSIATQVRADLAGPLPDHTDRIIDLTVPPDPKPADWPDKQKAPLLIGQLKAISKPFYDRLNTAARDWLDHESSVNAQKGQLQLNGTKHTDPLNAGNFYPWTVTTADDANKGIATVGQLKAVFSLRFTEDLDSNQLPDFWEILHFGHTGIDPNGDDDGDGLSNAEEQGAGSSPNDSRPPIAQFTRIDNPDGTVTYSWISFAYQGEWFRVETQLPDGTLKTIYATTYGSTKLPFVSGKKLYTLTLNPSVDFLP